MAQRRATFYKLHRPSSHCDNDVPEPRRSEAFFFALKARDMPRLFMANIPCDCQGGELRGWIEAHGFDMESVRVIRDLVAGVSPAFAYVSLRGATHEADVIKVLDGQNLKGRKLQVREDWRDGHRCG